MTIEFEEKYTTFDDVCFAWYITSDVNEYRMTLEFVGGLDENDEEYLEASIMASIELSETKHNDHSILEKVQEKLAREVDTHIEATPIMICAPDIRESIVAKNEVSFDDSIADFHKILSALSAVLIEMETSKDIERERA